LILLGYVDISRSKGKPQSVNINNLFDEDSEELESTVNKEAPALDVEVTGYMAFKQVYGDYSALKDIEYASIQGNLDESHAQILDQIGERLDNTKYQSISSEVADILVASRAALHKIKKYANMD